MEQDFKPSLYLQVVREFTELSYRLSEHRQIADIIMVGSYLNEQFDEFVELINEGEKLVAETKLDIGHKSPGWDSWYQYMISRTRKLRAKLGGPNFIFPRVSSSQSMMVPLSLCEELYSEIMSQINTVHYAVATNILYASNNHEEDEFSEDLLNEMGEFWEEIKLQLVDKNPVTNSDWYCNKIAEARALIAKCRPEFSLQSQGHVGFSLIRLHEELRCEIRSLIRMKCADLGTFQNMPNDHRLKDEFKEEVLKRKNEVNNFLTEVNLQLQENILEKNSDWYHNKIAESKMLIAKSYPPFPFQTRDVGYIKEEFEIFLSFRGEDTRQGFTCNLYHALHQEGFNVFMDDRGLHNWDPIEQATMEAIENSKLSIIVFSENFAESSECLDEVVEIVECMEKNFQQVWSVFYKVDPSDVRHQKNNFEKAMVKQETIFGKYSEKVKNWRLALKEVCGLNAYHYKEDSGCEDDFIQGTILKEVINIKVSL